MGSNRLKHGQDTIINNEFNVTLHDDLLDQPLRWKKSKFIFVNSMSDFLHEDVPLSFVQRIFAVMSQAHWHSISSLDEEGRSELEEVAPLLLASNVWLGVTVRKRYVDRVRHFGEDTRDSEILSPWSLFSADTRTAVGRDRLGYRRRESGPMRERWNHDWVRTSEINALSEDPILLLNMGAAFEMTAAGR